MKREKKGNKETKTTKNKLSMEERIPTMPDVYNRNFKILRTYSLLQAKFSQAEYLTPPWNSVKRLSYPYVGSPPIIHPFRKKSSNLTPREKQTLHKLFELNPAIRICHDFKEQLCDLLRLKTMSK